MKFFERRRLVNGLLVASLALHLATLAYLANSGGLRRILMKFNLADVSPERLDFQAELESRYRKLPEATGGVVFAGDSLVSGGPWADFYSAIHGRGIGGETTSGFLGRVDRIASERPREIVLLLGTNDLAAGAATARVVANYRAILGRIGEESPATEVVVIGVLPVNEGFPQAPPHTNEQIRDLNRRLKDLVAGFPRARFVDLADLLVNGAGRLRREFTPDGLHLNLDGYLAIRDRLAGHVLVGGRAATGPPAAGDAILGPSADRAATTPTLRGPRSMKILLTGGAGYIGGACLRWLLKNGHDPIAFDDMSEGNAAAVPEGRLVVGDINDTAALTQALRSHRAEAVMHFAALASVPLSIADPSSYWRVNAVGTRSVLEAMRSAGVARIVFSSTAATYAFGVEMPIRETTPQVPETPYGTTKLAAEWMIKEYARAYGIGYTIFRYFNAAGADPDGRHGESRHAEGHIIPLTLLVAAGRREKLRIFGGDWETRDGTCVRDYVHTDDLAQAHQLAVESLGPGVAREYNLGSGTGTTILEVLRACEAAVGRPIPHEVVGRRPGDPGTLIATPEKVARELGWSPRYPDIGSIVETAWRWHGTHPDGYATEGAP